MTILKMVDSTGKNRGLIDWFAVHCTSMNNTNGLISGDNKGYASYLMEKYMNKGALPGKGDFVAAFAQSNEGDVSPNTKGPHCLDTGLPCDFNHSTCNGKTELCVAFGPGEDMFDSTRIIGEKQYLVAKALFDNATSGLSGPVDYIHTFVDFSNVTLSVDGKEVHTCPPAMGFSFAAGTIDGPGAFSFTQGDTNGNEFWKLVRNFLKDPSKEQIDCHHPKPILLDTGEMTYPYPWQPKILPLQLLRVGQLVIIGVPAEFSTMSGRRLRNSVKKVLLENGFKSNVTVVIAGLSNTYSDYVTTFEEYQIQRYEGASTVYGPHTLNAYIQEFGKLAVALAKSGNVDPGPPPPNYLHAQWSLHTGVIFDAVPSGKSFGDVNMDVKSSYKLNDTVLVEFWAGNPRNNLMTENTFLNIELKNNSQHWVVVHTDASWETKFSWRHTSEILGESLATVIWNIPSDAVPGTYRIQHLGYHKEMLSGKVIPYSGVSSEFHVTTM